MPQSLESRLFSTALLEQKGFDSFRKDVEIVSAVEPKNWEAIVDLVVGLIKDSPPAKSGRARTEILAELSTSGLLPKPQSLHGIIRFSKYILSSLSDSDYKEDSVDSIVNDLVTLECFERFEDADVEKRRQSIHLLITLLKKETGWYHEERLREEFQDGLLPALEGMKTTVELRGVFERDIEAGESADDLKGQIGLYANLKVVPVISIALTMDSGTPKRLCFQSSIENLELLIEELKFAREKSLVLERAFKNKED